MANPFSKLIKTAVSSQKPYDRVEESSTFSIKCSGCGAARPQDTNLVICDYCGFKFMDINAEIAADIKGS